MSEIKNALEATEPDMKNNFIGLGCDLIKFTEEKYLKLSWVIFTVILNFIILFKIFGLFADGN